MNYIVAEVTTPDGIFFTARNDDRTAREVVRDCTEGFVKRGIKSPLYESVYKHQACIVRNLFAGLTKAEAEAKKKTLIEYSRAKGIVVLNTKV